jgi:hypothetical protein
VLRTGRPKPKRWGQKQSEEGHHYCKRPEAQRLNSPAWRGLPRQVRCNDGLGIFGILRAEGSAIYPNWLTDPKRLNHCHTVNFGVRHKTTKRFTGDCIRFDIYLVAWDTGINEKSAHRIGSLICQHHLVGFGLLDLSLIAEGQDDDDFKKYRVDAR